MFYTYEALRRLPDFPCDSYTGIKSLVASGELEAVSGKRPKIVTEESVLRYIAAYQDFLADHVPIAEAIEMFGGKTKLYHLIQEGLLHKVLKLNRAYVTKKSIKAYENFKKRYF